MSQHEKTAWWSLGSGSLIWLFLLMRFTEAGRTDRTPSVPVPDLGSTTALIFALLTMLFLADAVKQAVVLWQYRR